MPDDPRYFEIVPYLKGELLPTDACRFEQAMAADEALAVEVEAVRRTLARFQELPDQTPPRGAFDRLRQALRHTPQERSVRPTLPDLREVPRRVRLARTAAALAVAASIVVLLVFGFSQRDTGSAPARPVAQVLQKSGRVFVEDLRPGSSQTLVAVRQGIYGGQRVTTAGAASSARIGFGRTTIHLSGDAAVDLPWVADRSRGDLIFVQRGRVGFAVATPPASTPPQVPPPVTVLTEFSEIVVRGTRFFVDAQPGLTAVLVLKGQVHVYGRTRAGRVPGVPFERVTSGEFALARPTAPPEAGSAPLGAGGSAPETSFAPHIEVAHAPLVRVGLDLGRQAHVRKPDAPVAVRITLTNVSPWPVTLERDSVGHRDNVLLRYRRVGGGASTEGWAPVRRATADLPPGGVVKYRHELPRVLGAQGSYFFAAAYEGRVTVSGLGPLGRESPEWRSVWLSSRSDERSLAYELSGSGSGHPEVPGPDEIPRPPEDE